MNTVQVIYLFTILLNLAIIGLVVYGIYAIIKAVKKHFTMLSEVKKQLEEIRQHIKKA